MENGFHVVIATKIHVLKSQGTSELPKVKVKTPKSLFLLRKVERLNLQYLVVLMPLEIKYHTAFRLKTFISSL